MTPTLLLLAGLVAQPLPTPDIADTVYARVGSVDLKLDLYYPDPRPQGPLPLIVWTHGGGWQSGSKADCRPALNLLASGYAVASVGYRLSGVATWPAQIHDVKGAVRWLRAHAASLSLDTARFAAWGSSAGGHLASMLGTSGGVDSLEGTVGGNLDRSSRVKAVVDWYGPADLLTMGGSHDQPGSPEAKLLGCAIPACPEQARGASPIHHVSAGDPPFVLFHGTADGTVPHAQSVALDSALRKAGVPSALWTLPGAGHGGPEFSADSNIARVAAFLDARVKGAAQGNFTVTGNPETTQGAAWTWQENAPEAAYDLTGRVWRPAGTGPFPVVLVNHGTGGSADSYSKRVAQEMVKWGYACFAPNYTHSDGVPCGSPGACVEAEYAASPANILRGLKALSLLGRLPYLDTNAVFAFGHSRGAYLTVALAGSTPRFRAVAHTAGGVIPDAAQGTAARDAHARKITAPYLLHHGDLDNAVPLAFGRRLDSLLAAGGVPHRLDLYPGYGHNEIPYDTAMFRRTREWFDRYRQPSPVRAAPDRKAMAKARIRRASAGRLGIAPPEGTGEAGESDFRGRRSRRN